MGAIWLLLIGAGLVYWWFFGRKARSESADPLPPSERSRGPLLPQRGNSLASAVEKARKIAREEWERRQAEKDQEVGLRDAEARLNRVRQYLREAHAEEVIPLFLEKTEHWESWHSHEQKPLAYLDEHDIRVSEGLNERDPNGKKHRAFTLHYGHRAYRIAIDLSRAYFDDDGGEYGKLTVHQGDAEEPVLIIAVNRRYTEWGGGDWTASLYGLEVCRTADWLPDFAMIAEIADNHTKEYFRETQRKQALERSARTFDPS